MDDRPFKWPTLLPDRRRAVWSLARPIHKVTLYICDDPSGVGRAKLTPRGGKKKDNKTTKQTNKQTNKNVLLPPKTTS
jgi:hypothetical protein